MLKMLRYCGVALILPLAACGGDDDANPPVALASPVNNVQPVRIDRAAIHTATMNVQTGQGYNRVLTSVTLCSDAAGTHCQTIDDIVVDTGSVGLKVFNYALADGGASLADEHDANSDRVAICARYGSGYAWGQMKVATLRIAGETAANLPIAVINGAATTAAESTADQNLLPVPTDCSMVSGKAAPRKFRDSNGILGIGAPFSDCADCAVTTNYYGCTSSGTCTPTFIPSHMQTTQPVASFAADNNGLILELPSVGNFSTAPLDGQLVFGIGTQPDNQPAAVTAFSLDERGQALLSLGGSVNQVLVDSGTPDNLFASTLPTNASGRYAPPAPVNLAGTFLAHDVTGSGQNNQAPINFNVADPAAAFAANAVAIDGTGGPLLATFKTSILGLPFFFGKNIYIGVAGRSSNLGTGPLIAF